MARPLVHRTVHKGDRPGGGSGWACPFCPQQVVFWPLFHKVTVKGQADALHVAPGKQPPDQGKRGHRCSRLWVRRKGLTVAS
jgi:hypothetical protein